MDGYPGMGVQVKGEPDMSSKGEFSDVVGGATADGRVSLSNTSLRTEKFLRMLPRAATSLSGGGCNILGARRQPSAHPGDS